MKICSNCGKECNDDIRFCMFCGNPFPVAEEFVTPEEPVREEYTETQTDYSEAQQTGQQNAEQQYSQYQQQAAGPQYQQYGGQQYGGQQYQQYGSQQYAGSVPAEKGYSGFSIAALILGLVSIFFGSIIVPPILAIVFGGIGMGKAKQGYKGRGMAIAGLVLGIITLVVYLIIVIMAVVFGLAVVSGLGSALGYFY